MPAERVLATQQARDAAKRLPAGRLEMKPRVRGSALVLICVAAALVTFSVTASGCSKQTSASATKIVVVSLAADGDKLPDETKTITLARGQSLGVQSKNSGGPGYWSEMNAGNTEVMAPGKTVTVIPCPAHVTGCAPTKQKIYTAKASGKSTLAWTFRGVGPGVPAPASQPRLPCSSGLTSPNGENGALCPVGVVRISVTVT